MKYLGNASSILGIRISRNENLGTISIDQTSYIFLYKYSTVDDIKKF